MDRIYGTKHIQAHTQDKTLFRVSFLLFPEPKLGNDRQVNWCCPSVPNRLLLYIDTLLFVSLF